MRRRKARLYAVLLAALYLVLLVGVLVDRLSAVLVGAIGSFVVDYLLRRTRYRALLSLLGRVGLAMSWRVFYRQILIVFFLLRETHMSVAAARVVVVVVVAHHLLLALFVMERATITRLRVRRIETRNLAIPGAALPRALPAWLLARGSSLVLLCEAFFIAGLAYTGVTDHYEWVAPGAVLMDFFPALIVLRLVPQLRALQRMPGSAERWDATQEAVNQLAPLVVLYFSGGGDSTFQVNMWLETMEQLGGRVLVVLRERNHLGLLRKTTLPIICLPVAVDMMNFQLPTVRVGLYVVNVGKNIHLLRVPTMMSAFIGHGDSDKTASFNPYSKVYDEVWVAGEAGRQRYLKAQVGVRDDEIVLVGRPQLDAIRSVVERPPGSSFTVLYAPTWEGWTDDLRLSSLVAMGREMIALLLATPSVRVIYKPHPLTGSVQREAREASNDIVRMLTAAGAQHISVRNNSVSLYECFDQSDALISDISSVVSDYLKSQKPYFVTNNADLPAAEFRQQNSAAGGAYLIGPQARGLAEGLQDARTADSLVQRRREVSTYVLGDPDASAIDLFRAAVVNLAAKAEQQLSAHQANQDAAHGDEDERMDAEAAFVSTSANGRRPLVTVAAGTAESGGLGMDSEQAAESGEDEDSTDD